MKRPRCGYSLASALVGPNPAGALKVISTSVRSRLPKTSPVLVACSGGADSLALAVTTIDLLSRQGRRCYAAVVDHGMREESACEAQAVAALLRLLGAQARVLSVTASTESCLEAAAREVRYTALADEARSLGAVVLLGHTADDQAETVLMALARGSGNRSLRAMLPSRDVGGITWVRPLLGVRRAQTEAACAQLGLVPVYDPTNRLDGPWRRADGEALVRVSLRHDIMPRLERALGCDPVPALVRSASLAAADEDALTLWANQIFSSAATISAGVVQLCITQLVTVPVAVRKRTYRLAVEHIGAESMLSAHYDAVDALVVQWHGQGTVAAPGIYVRREKNSEPRIVFEAVHI